MPDTFDQARVSRIPGGIPLFLLDATSFPEVPFTTEAFRASRLRNRLELAAESIEYKEWLAAIPGSRLIVTDRSGDNIPQEQPELVVETVREAVEEVTKRLRR